VSWKPPLFLFFSCSFLAYSWYFLCVSVGTCMQHYACTNFYTNIKIRTFFPIHHSENQGSPFIQAQSWTCSKKVFCWKFKTVNEGLLHSANCGWSSVKVLVTDPNKRNVSSNNYCQICCGHFLRHATWEMKWCWWFGQVIYGVLCIAASDCR
jgi:hypothetical protein